MVSVSGGDSGSGSGVGSVGAMVVRVAVRPVPLALHVLQLVEGLGGAEVVLEPVGRAGGGALEEMAGGPGQAGPQGGVRVHGVRSKG